MQVPLTTYHSHTTFSDGQTELPELVAAAEARGMQALGVSDHLVWHPTLKEIEWSMKLDQVPVYVETVRACGAKASIPVHLGVEIDFFPDSPHAEALDALVLECGFDYVIGSVHMIGEFPLDSYRRSWAALTQEQVDDYHVAYWKAITRMVVDCPWVSVVGHLDLPKKFGFLPSTPLNTWMNRALDAIVSSGVAIELNTAGWDKPCSEGYPGEELLVACRDRGIPLVVNDDAHAPSLLCRHYERASELLTRLGYVPDWQV